MAGLVAYFIFLVAPTWQWLLLAMAAMSMASSFVAPSFQAFIAEQANKENLGRVYGLTESLFMVVWIVGPPLGGLISDQFSFRAMFLVSAVLYATATVVRLFMARNARKSAPKSVEKPTIKGLKTSLVAMAGMILGGGVITWVFISDSVRDIAYNMSFQFEPLYLQNLMGLTNSQIGLLASFAALTTMVFMTAAGWLSDKKGERVGIVLGFALSAVGMIIFLTSRNIFGFAVAWIMYGLAHALIGPAYNALISKSVPNKLRGTAFGLFSTSIGVLSLPAPLVGSMLWNRVSPRAPFLVPLIATVLLLPVMWVKFRLPEKDVESEGLPAADLAPATGD
jgi:MFS family permease